jgi:hypothetical protein
VDKKDCRVEQVTKKREWMTAREARLTCTICLIVAVCGWSLCERPVTCQVWRSASPSHIFESLPRFTLTSKKPSRKLAKACGKSTPFTACLTCRLTIICSRDSHQNLPLMPRNNHTNHSLCANPHACSTNQTVPSGTFVKQM